MWEGESGPTGPVQKHPQQNKQDDVSEPPPSTSPTRQNPPEEAKHHQSRLSAAAFNQKMFCFEQKASPWNAGTQKCRFEKKFQYFEVVMKSSFSRSQKQN